MGKLGCRRYRAKTGKIVVFASLLVKNVNTAADVKNKKGRCGLQSFET